MAIDIRNINEITFSQSFRGYNTDEVDDFLDDIYDEAVNNNKEIQELKKRIEELESGAPVSQSADDGVSQEEAYAIIANAQEEADRIVETARQKAHALILEAEKAQEIQASQPAPAPVAQTTSQIDVDAVDRLKQTLREMYQKQLAVLDDISTSAPAPKYEAPSYEPPVFEAPAPTMDEEQSIPVQEDMPSISFSGLTRKVTPKIPAERDILGEINAINFGEKQPEPQPQTPIEAEPSTIELDMADTRTFEKAHEPEPEPEAESITFAFEMPEEKTQQQEEPQKQQSFSFGSTQPEDPDDIIAQILRDNNRN